MVLGALFTLLAAVGVLRMPDVFTRLQAATKSASFGTGATILSVAIYFGELGISTRALLVIVFIFLTAPVAAHMIARAAYRLGAPKWDGTVVDELAKNYNPETHTLTGDMPDR